MAHITPGVVKAKTTSVRLIELILTHLVQVFPVGSVLHKLRLNSFANVVKNHLNVDVLPSLPDRPLHVIVIPKPGSLISRDFLSMPKQMYTPHTE